MVEGELNEASESEMVDVIKVAHESIKKQCQFQLDLASEIPAAAVKREYSHEEHDEDVRTRVAAFSYDKCRDVARQGLASKDKRAELFGAIKEEFLASLTEEESAEIGKYVSVYFKESMKKAVRDTMLNDNIRLDGRKFDEVRPIWSEVNYLPTAHGSAVFTRGETQSLMTLTLGGKMDEQMIDDVTFKGTTPFMLHYNFPPFSTGEARMKFNVSRREIGHGNLALRALRPVLPDDNPYTIRLVSEILESNGSSSMATVCAGTLALMDGGIQIKAPVSGIAMGLVAENGKFAVLSDILGDEDHLGDMDFKVAGTKEGITALQMDIKIEGINEEIMRTALAQARDGRLTILETMNANLSTHREEMSEFAPRIITIKVHTDKIRDVIGKGGATIRALTEETGAVIDIQDDGTVMIFSSDYNAGQDALHRIEQITAEVEVGKIYQGTVAKLMDFGAFVTILPGKDGLVHISQISDERVENISDKLSEGDSIKVKVLEVDRQGRIRLSMKAVSEESAD